MSADPLKTLRDRQLQYQAEPVVLVDPATGEAGAIRLSGRTAVSGANQALPVTQGTLTMPPGATVAVIQVEGGSIRYLSHGAAEVTSSTGKVAPDLSEIHIYDADELALFSAITESGTPQLNITYEA